MRDLIDSIDTKNVVMSIVLLIVICILIVYLIPSSVDWVKSIRQDQHAMPSWEEYIK